jgi:hypothetical protein
MKTIKVIACIAMVLSAIAYAATPPTPAGGLMFKALKTGGSITYTNGWIVCSDTTGKQTITLDTKNGPSPSGQSIIILGAKGLKGSTKTVTPALGFSNVLYGTFASGMEGDLTQYTFSVPAKSFAVSLKGITVGTVIAQRCAPKCDSLKNAIVTEIKLAKGAQATASGKAPSGVLGGIITDRGFLGVPPQYASVWALAPYYSGGGPSKALAAIGKATGKGSISYVDIYAQSLPEKKPGKPASSLSTKVLVDAHALTNVPGPSSYKIGKDLVLLYDVVLP